MKVTEHTVTNVHCDILLRDAHLVPMHVRHAASVVRYSTGATMADRRMVAEAINQRCGAA